jgi:glycosyltransferase involved in cell wall biosynthesis
LETLTIVPRVCLIVDSSQDSRTKEVVIELDKHSRIKFVHLDSLPGLPHQRNTGIKYLKANEILKNNEIVSFLDDDVRVSPDYFENVSYLFNKYDEANSIGGYWIGGAAVNSSSLIRRLTLLGSKYYGVVLKSGIAIAPNPTHEIVETQWVPGAMQNIRMRIFSHALFNGKIRMYGEDVEFYSRISKYGKVFCSDRLPVKHLEAIEERDDLRKVVCFTDGFRWTMALNRLSGVRKYAVLLSTFILMFADFTLWIVQRREQNRQSMFGHKDFIQNILSGSEVQQFVDHRRFGKICEF